MSDLCLLVSGGDLSELPGELSKASFVIACDLGWQHAEKLGLRPDLIVGDFDSSEPPAANVPVERAPRMKDDTDTMIASRRALEMGFRDIAICCAFGGRLDHTLANLQTAAFLASHGARVRLTGKDNDALVFGNRTERVPRRAGWSLSVFSMSDQCVGVTIRGTKYECEDITLTNAFPLGVSNEWVSDEAEISVSEGIILVLQSVNEERSNTYEGL